MGKALDFAAAERRPRGPGVSVAPLLDWFDSAEMMASIIRLAPASRHGIKVPAGSDQYLFVLAGEARIAAGSGAEAALAPERFLIDGKERVLGAGEAAFFPVDDRHGLKSADGNELSFLELHIPGAFRTEYDE